MSDHMLISHCNSCRAGTKHEILHKREVVHRFQAEYEPPEEWTDTYTMLECRGCECVSMRIDCHHSEFGADQPEFYPPRISRDFPEWRWQLSGNLYSLMQEVYGALHANSRRLAVMGARTLIDLYLTETVGSHGTFDQRLDRLIANGKLALDDKPALTAALEAGHAAAHRGHSPEVGDLNAVMDIVEHLLQKLALKNAAEGLQKNTPPRPAKPVA